VAPPASTPPTAPKREASPSQPAHSDQSRPREPEPPTVTTPPLADPQHRRLVQMRKSLLAQKEALQKKRDDRRSRQPLGAVSSNHRAEEAVGVAPSARF
jgi:hypothetical protein